jgi:hypothetical protein
MVNLSRPGSPTDSSNVGESIGHLVKRFDTIVGYCEPEDQQNKQDEATFEIFKILPAFSGLYLFHARAHAAKMALRLTKNAGVMTVMAHLYNSMEKLEILKTRWPDMEAFEKCFEVRDLFFADKPASRKHFMTRLLIQLGYPASAVKTPKESRVQRKAPRGFFKSFTKGAPGIAPVSMIFAETVNRRSGLPELSWDDLAYVVPASLHKETIADDGTNVLISLDLEEKRKVKNRIANPKSKDRQKSAPLSPDQQLRQFALALAGEARELAFPYVEMHNLCIQLFDRISDRCASTLEAVGWGPDPLDGNLIAMLRVISLASESNHDVPLSQAADEIEKHINTDPAIVSKLIADVPDSDGASIPSVESYKVTHRTFIKLSVDKSPLDEEIVISFEEIDSAPGEMEETRGTT